MEYEKVELFEVTSQAAEHSSALAVETATTRQSESTAYALCKEGANDAELYDASNPKGSETETQLENIISEVG